MILSERLIGKNVEIRSVTIDDAQFILDLRLDPKLNRFLGVTSPKLEKQQNWILQQIQKEGDYYFLLENKIGDKIGTGGIYNIEGKNFSCGRWIIKKDASPIIAVESIILSYDFAFNHLELDKASFEVSKENIKVSNFHLSYGAEIYKETETDYHFQFFRNSFKGMLMKFKSFHKINIL